MKRQNDNIRSTGFNLPLRKMVGSRQCQMWVSPVSIHHSDGPEPMTSTSSATTATTATASSSSVVSSMGWNSGLTGSSKILTCRQPSALADFSLRMDESAPIFGVGWSCVDGRTS